MMSATFIARATVARLIAQGVREAVVCPGSRNAPLMYALTRAERAGKLRLHVRIDERGAGFLALGLSKGSDRPVPVVVTSGTAVANLLPAVMEANLTRVALIVISANRPYELLGTGANQTVDQVDIFGRHVVASTTFPALDGSDNFDVRRPGPQQIDIPLRPPLVPSDESSYGEDPVDFCVAEDSTAQMRLTPVRGRLDATKKTIVIAGYGAHIPRNLADFPTVAEPMVKARRLLHPLALTLCSPEQVVVLGRPTLHRAVEQLIAHTPTIAVGDTWGWHGAASAFYDEVSVDGQPNPHWIESTANAHEVAVKAVERELDLHAHPTGLGVARWVGSQVRAGDALFLGASNPIRDVSLAAQLSTGVEVLTNRGASGIDGTIATSIGAALTLNRRTIALMGDVTFLHDSGSLQIGPGEPRPRDLTIVVANDNGGGIFALLEQGDDLFARDFERIFGTPHNIDLESIARAYSWDFLRNPESIPSEPGMRVVEMSTTRIGLRDLHARINAAIVSDGGQ